MIIAYGCVPVKGRRDESPEDVRQQVAVIVAEREYPASPGALCGYCDFLEICPGGKGFVESQPAALEEEPPLE